MEKPCGAGTGVPAPQNELNCLVTDEAVPWEGQKNLGGVIEPGKRHNPRVREKGGKALLYLDTLWERARLRVGCRRERFTPGETEAADSC